MTCDFMSLLTVFQSYQGAGDNKRLCPTKSGLQLARMPSQAGLDRVTA